MHILRLNAVPDFEARSQLGVRGMKERERERERGKKKCTQQQARGCAKKK